MGSRQAAQRVGKTIASTGSTKRRAAEARVRLMRTETSQETRLLLLLAGDAPLGPRHRFQALLVQLLLAHHARPVLAVVDAHDGLVDEGEHVALGVGEA